MEPIEQPPPPPALQNHSPQLLDSCVKEDAVNLYGLTLKSFNDFKNQNPNTNPFRQNFDSILTNLAKGRELMALFTIFRNSLKGIIIHVKGGRQCYFPITANKINTLENKILEWKVSIEHAM